MLVTVNSTAAIEAMPLDVPALVVALPNNLTPFVEAGAMAGAATAGGDRARAARVCCMIVRCASGLAAARRAFIDRYGIGADGGAAARAADLIVGLARTLIRT